MKSNFRHYTVDDYFPCKKGTKDVTYMKPNGAELWAILMEKAFAKFCGSYGALDGGWAVWAWEAMTGDYVLQFRQKPNSAGRDVQPALIGRYYVTERDSAPVLYNGIV